MSTPTATTDAEPHKPLHHRSLKVRFSDAEWEQLEAVSAHLDPHAEMSATVRRLILNEFRKIKRRQPAASD